VGASGRDLGRLIVPFGDVTETLTVAFDPATGLLARMESLRFRDETDAPKVRWTNDAHGWDELDGVSVPLRTSVTWADEGTPWARLQTERAHLLRSEFSGASGHVHGPACSM
jgi:hypothetical protein